jgi:hypothetical protein
VKIERKLLQADVVIQSVLISVAALAVAVEVFGHGKEGSFYLGILAFLLLLVWQFFSGIYIGVEYRIKHRSIFQLGYFGLGMTGLVFTFLGMPFGLLVVFSFTPIVMITYFLVSCNDLRRAIMREDERTRGTEHILDSGDVFD